MQAVVLPILEANMTHGVVRAWLKREGDRVQAGEALFEVETDKVNAEVEAETTGVLRHIVAPVGTRVPVLGILAFIGAADEAVPEPETWKALVPPTARAGQAARPPVSGQPMTPPTQARPGTRTAATRVPASPAARRLARERGVPLDRIQGTGPHGEITRADVEAQAGCPPATSGSGHVDASFVDLLRRDAAAFRHLSSEAKVQLYRQHGARIGEQVRIERGAIIVAREIHIGAASRIGAESTIECDQLQLGRLVAFGERTRVRCRSLDVGDALWSKDDVVIGGGGSDAPGARLRAGAACFFGEGAYLNTCHPLTLGDEVCVGSRAMLFTHSHWQSVLRGYPSLFGPVEAGDHVFIGNNAFVFPGVSIGSGATVMVNSFVAVNVPPRTLVGGVPAQVLRHIVQPTRVEQLTMLREHFMPALTAALRGRGYSVVQRADGETTTLAIDDAAEVQLRASWEPTAAGPHVERMIVLAFAGTAARPLAPGVTLFDLLDGRVLGVQDALSDEVREFCRRRGIRFRPFAWRYGVGHFEGDRFYPRAGRPG
ncbi:MAG: E3 binding domain-containing protein [Candidatus Binatia bacterium]